MLNMFKIVEMITDGIQMLGIVTAAWLFVKMAWLSSREKSADCI
ncbi:MAG: hypothetical protein AB7S78_13190 [Candidatus Omnitrophota bacterium]